MPKKFVPGKFALKVRRSRAGLGLFTEEAIPKGACIIEYKGRVISEREKTTSRSRYLFEITDTKTIDGTARTNTARYINHSCLPNCEVEIVNERVYVMARKNIKPGEELSYDYGKEYTDQYCTPCKCPKCDPEPKLTARAR